MPDTQTLPSPAPVSVKQNLLAAISEPATLRTLIVCAAIVVALITAIGGGSINVGSSGELIEELQLTRGSIDELRGSMHSLELAVADISYRVDRLERQQDESDDPPND